jgi:hypothetical protein
MTTTGISILHTATIRRMNQIYYLYLPWQFPQLAILQRLKFQHLLHPSRRGLLPVNTAHHKKNLTVTSSIPSYTGTGIPTSSWAPTYKTFKAWTPKAISRYMTFRATRMHCPGDENLIPFQHPSPEIIRIAKLIEYLLQSLRMHP